MIATDIDGTQVRVSTTNGAYKYLGKLAVGFRPQGKTSSKSLSPSAGRSGSLPGPLMTPVKPDRRITREVVEPVADYVRRSATIVVGTSEVPLNSARS